MHHIIHRIGIKASIDKVYQAIATIKGLSGWWTEETEGDEKAGGRIEFRFRNNDGTLKGQMKMEIKSLNKPSAVQWECVEGPAEWIGTQITFDLSEQDGQTILLFGHRNWKEAVEFSAHCSMKWAVFLLSLRELVETGKGKPAPYDTKIDNWN